MVLLHMTLVCQVFTSGRFIFLYFFEFLTLDLAGMILAFFSYFWLMDVGRMDEKGLD